MPDIDNLVQVAHVSNPLREPALRSAIQALQFPSGSRGLDAGCGIGLQAMLLAETVGSGGHITDAPISAFENERAIRRRSSTNFGTLRS